MAVKRLGYTIHAKSVLHNTPCCKLANDNVLDKTHATYPVDG
jgi:hypothetical protein